MILSSRQRYQSFNMFKTEDIGDELLVLEQKKKVAWYREIAKHTKVRGVDGRGREEHYGHDL